MQSANERMILELRNVGHFRCLITKRSLLGSMQRELHIVGEVTCRNDRSWVLIAIGLDLDNQDDKFSNSPSLRFLYTPYNTGTYTQSNFIKNKNKERRIY